LTLWPTIIFTLTTLNRLKCIITLILACFTDCCKKDINPLKTFSGTSLYFGWRAGQYLLGMCYFHDKEILTHFHGSEVTLSLTYKRFQTWELDSGVRISERVHKTLVLFGMEWKVVGGRNCLLITNELAGFLLRCDGVISADNVTGSSTQRI
jgi:hypothetical protein